MTGTDWTDEETDPVLAPQERCEKTEQKRYELVWVDDPKLGMVLRVRRIEG